MSRSNRSEPMPVKHWSFAGLMLTYWCNARCASCYVGCGPERSEWMTADGALEWWRQLAAASPHGCRIHLTGGEPFGRWPVLIDLCRRAREAGLPPAESIETNAYWATDGGVVRQRVGELDAVGMQRLTISADPYHQQFVPIARCRLAAKVAREVLGPHRVRVRWEDWLAEGCDTGELDARERMNLFVAYASRGRERPAGRAAATLAERLGLTEMERFADSPCKEPLLRSRHVHVDCDGRVMPGTCAGIVLAALGPDTVADAWRRLDDNWRTRPIVGALAVGGPMALLDRARELGFTPAAGYAGKCHLCWELRRFLVEAGEATDELGPGWLYEEGPSGIAKTPTGKPR